MVMEALGATMESLYHEKILLYQELLDALDQERKTIIDIDVDALWKISEQKNKIARKIEQIYQRMLKLLDELSIAYHPASVSFDSSKVFSLMPTPVKERLHKAHVTLVTLKNEAGVRLSENRRYVEAYLTVFDELIGIITQAGLQKPVYDRSRYPAKSSTHLFLNREA